MLKKSSFILIILLGLNIIPHKAMASGPIADLINGMTVFEGFYKKFFSAKKSHKNKPANKIITVSAGVEFQFEDVQNSNASIHQMKRKSISVEGDFEDFF